MDEKEIVHLFREGSWITLCCHRYVLDKRLHIGTFEPDACTCLGRDEEVTS